MKKGKKICIAAISVVLVCAIAVGSFFAISASTLWIL